MAQPRFYWDAQAQRYRHPNGRFVPGKNVRYALDRALDGSTRRVREASIDLKEGRISLREWQGRMRDSIKETQVYSAAIARGGWHQMTKRDFGLAGSLVKKQYQFLNKFAAGIEDGSVLLDGRFLRRAELYSQAGWQTYTAFQELNARERGLDEEKNVLDPGAEHCGMCERQSAHGWVRMGSLIPIGGRTCRTRDRCHIEYRRRDRRKQRRRFTMGDEVLQARGTQAMPTDALDLVHEPPRMPDGWRVTGEMTYGDQIVFGKVVKVPHFQIESPKGEIFWVNGQGNAASKEYAARMKKLGYKRVGLGEKSATLARKKVAEKVPAVEEMVFDSEADTWWTMSKVSIGDDGLELQFKRLFDKARADGANPQEASKWAKIALGKEKAVPGESFRSRIAVESLPEYETLTLAVKRKFREMYDKALAAGIPAEAAIDVARVAAIKVDLPYTTIPDPEEAREKLLNVLRNARDLPGSTPRERAQSLADAFHAVLAPHAGIAGRPPAAILGEATYGNFYAWFTPGSRAITYGTEATRTLEQVVEDLRAGYQLKRHQLHAIESMFHELNHSVSPVAHKIGYQIETGRILEESMVEWKARKSAANLLRPTAGNEGFGLVRADALDELQHWQDNIAGAYIREVHSIRNYERIFGERAVDELWETDTYPKRTQKYTFAVRKWLRERIDASDMTDLRKRQFKGEIDDLTDEDLIEGFGRLDTTTSGLKLRLWKAGDRAEDDMREDLVRAFTLPTYLNP